LCYDIFHAGQLHSSEDIGGKLFEFGTGSGSNTFGSNSGLFSTSDHTSDGTSAGIDSMGFLTNNNAPRQDFQSVVDERDQLRAQLYVPDPVLSTERPDFSPCSHALRNRDTFLPLSFVLSLKYATDPPLKNVS
jgi:hypothetical protein